MPRRVVSERISRSQLKSAAGQPSRDCPVPMSRDCLESSVPAVSTARSFTLVHFTASLIFSYMDQINAQLSSICAIMLPEGEDKDLHPVRTHK